MDLKNKWRNVWNTISNNEDFSEVKRAGVKDILNGKFLTKDFLRKQYGLIVLLVFLAIAYIDNRFYCEKLQKNVVGLQKELKETKYEALTVSAKLMEMSRQSSVLRQLEERGVDLQESITPAIRVK